MRIISGIRRGHKLAEFEGSDIRPTTDRVRESLFNLISEYIPDSNVLDLFGGSGALSLEAVSRGARESTVCDIDKRAIELIAYNTERLSFGDRVKILNKSADGFIAECNDAFDIIFLDPPYNRGIIEPIMERLVQRGMLSEDGIIVLESDATDCRGDFSGLEIIKQRKYGRTYITVYKRR